MGEKDDKQRMVYINGVNGCPVGIIPDLSLDEMMTVGDTTQTDNVNHPSHYETGKFECIDVMVETQGVQATKDFCVCNALKYIYRHKRKNGLEDIQKAIWYLNKAVELDGQIKEQIDCRTIGDSEPHYVEGRSNEKV